MREEETNNECNDCKNRYDIYFISPITKEKICDKCIMMYGYDVKNKKWFKEKNLKRWIKE